MKRAFVILFLIACFHSAKAQNIVPASDTTRGRYFVLKTATYNGQTYPQVEMHEIRVYAHPTRKNRFDYHKYQRLVYNVKKAYPYALIVRKEMVRVNDLLGDMPNDRDRKEFLRKYEKDIFKKYEGDLSNFSISQAKILIKLIDRETQSTSFSLISEYRGDFSAKFWQGIARIFGTNLKSTYDAEGDDYLIEQIICEIDAGRL
jgi:hypothetical protein